MDKEQIVGIAREMIQAGRPFLLATVDEKNQPQMRWMGGSVLDEPLTVWMAGSATGRKMAQIRANAAAQLLYSDEKFGQTVTISGRAEVVDCADTKQRLWKAMPALARYMSGPDDPGFGVVKFTGTRVELLTMAEGMAPQVAEV
jgi:general stress protein 26